MHALSTCDLCDLYRDDDGRRIRVLPPVFRRFGGREAFAGPVRTVRCLDDNSSVKALLATPGAGAVLVVDGGASLRRALVGGNIAASAAAQGWAGVVVNGAVRDRDELADAALGLLALALVPMPTARVREGEVDVPVQIQGVWIRPADWLVADADGVVLLDRDPTAG